MAAGLGFKTFTTGEVLTAGDVNGYLMQGVLVFATAAARNSAITSPQEGQFAFTKDTNGLWYYDGAAWVASGATGDIEGVTAGVGITGGGTSGTVTVTNDMATTITTAGDLIKGTGSGTYNRLGIGTTGQVLTVASGAPSWATPTSGGMTLISTTSLTGASVTLSSIPGTYNNLMIVIRNYLPATDGASLFLRFNADSTGNRHSSTISSDIFGGGQGFSVTSSYGSNSADNATSQGLALVDIYDYTNTTTWKMLRFVGLTNNDGTTTNLNLRAGFGMYNQTGAVTSFELFPSSGNFTSGSALLYGVK